MARLIEAYADASEIHIAGLGSTTFQREDLEKALEPDECYYIQHAAETIGKERFDLTVDPPPNLAIEIDISPPDIARQPIYGALGVPEVGVSMAAKSFRCTGRCKGTTGLPR